jgi:hypothetical protein
LRNEIAQNKKKIKEKNMRDESDELKREENDMID